MRWRGAQQDARRISWSATRPFETEAVAPPVGVREKRLQIVSARARLAPHDLATRSAFAVVESLSPEEDHSRPEPDRRANVYGDVLATRAECDRWLKRGSVARRLGVDSYVALDLPHAGRPAYGSFDGVAFGPRRDLSAQDDVVVGHGDLNLLGGVLRMSFEGALYGTTHRREGHVRPRRLDRDEVVDLAYACEVPNRPLRVVVLAPVVDVSLERNDAARDGGPDSIVRNEHVPL